MFGRALFVLLVPWSLLAEPLLKPGDIVFGDGGLNVIIRYDPATQQTNHIATFDFRDATGNIAVGSNGEIYAMRAKLGFGSYAEFFVIDRETAESRVLSTNKLITNGRRMKISPDGKSLYVAGESDQAGRGVFKVEIDTGAQSIVTVGLTDAPDYERPWDVAFDGKGGIYVSDYNFGNLLHFDSAGNRRVVSSDGLFDFISGIDVDAEGNVYVASRNFHGIVRVDPGTGEQSPVTQDGVFRGPSDLCVAPDGSLLVTDAVADVLVKVNPETGEQTVLAQGMPGPRSPVIFSPREDVLLNASLIDGVLTLSWSNSTNTWILEERPSMNPDASWTLSSLIPASENGEHRVTLTPTSESLFFRLRKGQ